MLVQESAHILTYRLKTTQENWHLGRAALNFCGLVVGMPSVLCVDDGEEAGKLSWARTTFRYGVLIGLL